MRKFVSRAIKPDGDELLTAASGSEPPVPCAFIWAGRRFQIVTVLRTWRGIKTDRGDAYLKRHWFELKTADGATLEIYYDREARRGTSPWWLYTIEE